MKTRNAGGVTLSAIKGFNREWAAITSLHSMGSYGPVIGYKLTTQCGVERKFPNEHWDDPYGAAYKALENHRCRNAN